MSGVQVDERGESDAPLVVLIHGAMDRAASFARLARLLEGRHVKSYDRRGYARSAGLAGPYDLTTNVVDLATIVAERPVVIFGHSYGGIVALTFAARHPALTRALVVFEPPVPWLAEWPEDSPGSRATEMASEIGAEAAAEHFMRGVVGDAVWERLPEPTRAARRAEGRALISEIAELRAAAPFDVHRIAAPVVLARGERSSDKDQLGVVWLHRHLESCELHVVAGAGHGAHASHPEACARLVARAEELGGSAPTG